MSPLDTPLRATLFASVTATKGKPIRIALRDVESMIDKAHAEGRTLDEAKQKLPLLKLGRFDAHKRGDAHLSEVWGIEADYDGGQMSVADAERRLRKARIAAMIYTSPRHTAKAPRFRILCPFSKSLPPSKRAAMLARLNGVLGGSLAPESFTLSQIYFFGHVNGKRPKIVYVEGDAIDRSDDLDAGAIGKGEPQSDKSDTLDRSAVLQAIAADYVRKGATFAEFDSAWRENADAAAHVNKHKTQALRDRAVKRAWQWAKDNVTPYFEDHGDESKNKKRRGLSFFKAGEYDSLAPTFDFVPGTLQDSSVAMLYGPPASGKTFYALHLLCSVALGRPVFGADTTSRRGLYVGLEGEAGVKTRIQAWCIANGVDDSPIHYAFGSFDITDSEQRARLIEYIDTHRIQFVALDTLSRTMTGLDESTAKEMSPVIDGLHAIKAATGACVLAVTHTGKDVRAGIRGWSGQLGAADTTIEIVAHTSGDEEPRASTLRTARVRKQKDLEPAPDATFAFEIIETKAINGRGERVRSLALSELHQFADLTAANDSAGPKLSARERDMLTMIGKLGGDLGVPVRRDRLRARLLSSGWGPKREGDEKKWRAKWRQAFGRALENLTDAGRLQRQGDSIDLAA